MCWNAEVSIKTFFIGIAAIGFGAYLGLSLPVLLFCFTIVTMQLIEYIVWTYYDDDVVNFRASLAAVVLLWLQPIASMLLIPSISLRMNMISAYLLLSLIGILPIWNQGRIREFAMKRAENGHQILS